MELTYPNISCKFRSLKDFQNRDLAESVLKKIEEYGSDFIPDKFDFYEPLKKTYKESGLNEAVKLWINEEGNRNHKEKGHPYAVGQLIMHKKRGSKASYFVSWEKEKRKEFNLFTLRVDISFLQNKNNLQRFLDLCYELAELIEPVHGEIVNCSFPRWAEPLDLKVRIPELQWAVIFGKPYIKMFGMDRLMNTPCHKVEKINDDIFALYLTENVFEPISSNIRQEIKEYLGEDCFVEEGKTSHNYKSGKVPDFDFSQVVFRGKSNDELAEKKQECLNPSSSNRKGNDMRRNEIVNRIAEKTNIRSEDVELIIQSLQDIIEESLLKGDKIFLDGFGVFEPRLLPERIGEHPVNGNRVVIPTMKEVEFKASADFKKSINRC